MNTNFLDTEMHSLGIRVPYCIINFARTLTDKTAGEK